MTANTDHLRQALAEMGSGPNLNRLDADEVTALTEALAADIGALPPGAIVAILDGDRFLPAFGVITASDAEGITVRTSDEAPWPETHHFDAAGRNDGSRLIAFSGPRRGDAVTLIRTLNLHPGRFRPSSDDKGPSFYVIRELEDEARQLGLDLDLPMHGRINLGGPEDERLRALALTLPGRSDETTDTSRGYVGWGPYEDYTCDRTVEVKGFPALKALIETHGLGVYDFYFMLDHDSTDCPKCAGTGVSREYKEVSDSFYRHNGGRWAGWGERLTQEEVNVLAEKGRLTDFTHEFVTTPSERMTKEEILDRLEIDEEGLAARIGHGGVSQEGHYYRIQRGLARRADKYIPTAAEINNAYNNRGARTNGWMGHDGINHWIVVPVRAKALGISTEPCTACEGEGRIALSHEKLSLAVWAAIPERGISLAVQVNALDPAHIEDLRAFLAAHYTALRERLTALARFAPLFRHEIADQTANDQDRGGASDMDYPTWAAYLADMGKADMDYNVVYGYAFSAQEPRQIAHGVSSTAKGSSPDPTRIPTGGMTVFMAHPRKGSLRTIFIRSVSDMDRPSMIEYLEPQLATHVRHFAWTQPAPEGAEGPGGILGEG